MAHIKVKVYKFKQLSDKAKDRVRQWYAETLDYDWWELVYDQFIEEMAEYGIDIATKDIHFSGFWSQGDGAAFSTQMGSSDIVKYLKAHKLTKKYWALYCNLVKENIDLGLAIKESPRGYYMFLSYQGFENYHDLNAYSDYLQENYKAYDKINQQASDLADDILEYCQDRATDLYKRLEEEYDYLVSDESIKDSCKANGWRFTEDGRIV